MLKTKNFVKLEIIVIMQMNTEVLHIVYIIQSRTVTFQKRFFICLNESPLKIMKNTFYLI